MIELLPINDFLIQPAKKLLLVIVLLPLCIFFSGVAHANRLSTAASTPAISGELKKWHKITLTFDGPESSETGAANPFLDYRLNVTFRNGSATYVVPGYFAADGEAAETSATSGNKWRVHFAPDREGTWTYQVSFRKGNQVAISDQPNAGNSVAFDGESGEFMVGPTDKSGSDLRAKGRLQYVGKRYLRFKETGKYFIKAGADAPENFLAYADFDGTQQKDGNKDNLIKEWNAHVRDWKSSDPAWQNGKGKGMIGALNYLASKEMNVFSFLTMNIGGDDQNVFPYVKYNNTKANAPITDRLQFDCSKLDQWEIVFEHADKLGLYLHFKLQETENERLLDKGKLGVERKLYYREIIARFGHHLALNWNLSEESNIWKEMEDPDNLYVKSYTRYFTDQDPYHHHVVIHTYPDERKDMVYPTLLGNASALTGCSLQTPYNEVHQDTKKWLKASENAGKVWVVANDEQGSADKGVTPDGGGNNHDAIRKNVLWGNLMAGGAGVEYYFGYEYEHSDLTCEDWRSRDAMWDYTRYAVEFFREYVPFQEMSNENVLIGNTNDTNDRYCFAKKGEIYLIYLAQGGTATIDLDGYPGNYSVQWFNPRQGGALVSGTITQLTASGSVGNAPYETDQDWVVLLQNNGGGTPAPAPPTISISSPAEGETWQEDTARTITAQISGTTQTVTSVNFFANGALLGTDKHGQDGWNFIWNNAVAGNYAVQAEANTEAGNSYFSQKVYVSVTEKVTEEENVLKIEQLVLVNAESNQDIAEFNPLTEGAVINFKALGTDKLSIGAYPTEGATGSVQFIMDDEEIQVENVAPYAIGGDTNGDFNPWIPTLGAHTLTVIPYTGRKKSGDPGEALTVNFRVIDEAVAIETPTGLHAQITSDNKVEISWADQSDNETGFVVEKSRLPDTDFIVLNEVGENVIHCLQHHVVPGQTLYYRVKAINSDVSSAYSAVVSLTIPVVPVPPAPPAPPSPVSEFIIEAEDMNFELFRLKELPYASNSMMIEIGPESPRLAMAHATFNGISGKYAVEIAYLDETDGQSQLMVKIAGDTLRQWTLDQDLYTVGYGERGLVHKAVAAEWIIANGDEILLEGIKHKGERVVIDYLKFTQIKERVNLGGDHIYPVTPPNPAESFAKRTADTTSQQSAKTVTESESPEKAIEIISATGSFELDTVLEINVYPNPVADVLQVTAPQAGAYYLYDMQGRIAKEGDIQPAVNYLEVYAIPAGIYYLRISNGNTTVTKKIMIKH